MNDVTSLNDLQRREESIRVWSTSMIRPNTASSNRDVWHTSMREVTVWSKNSESPSLSMWSRRVCSLRQPSECLLHPNVAFWFKAHKNRWKDMVHYWKRRCNLKCTKKFHPIVMIGIPSKRKRKINVIQQPHPIQHHIHRLTWIIHVSHRWSSERFSVDSSSSNAIAR